jgi:hypothetical protein
MVAIAILLSIAGVFACGYLGWFHVSRAFRERGERETRDIVIGSAMAMSGVLPLMANGLLPLVVPRGMLLVLVIAAIMLMSFAGRMSERAKEGEGEEIVGPKGSGAEIFAVPGDLAYVWAAIIAMLANVMTFAK